MNKFDILCEHGGFIQSKKGPRAYFRLMNVNEVIAFQESLEDVSELELSTSIVRRTILYPSYDEYLDHKELKPFTIMEDAAEVVAASSPSDEEALETLLDNGRDRANGWLQSLIFTGMDQGNLNYSEALQMTLPELSAQIGYLHMKAEALNPRKRKANTPSFFNQNAVDRLNRNNKAAKGEAEIEKNDIDLVPMDEAARQRELRNFEHRKAVYEKAKATMKKHGKDFKNQEDMLLPMAQEDAVRAAYGVKTDAYNGFSAQAKAAFKFFEENPDKSKLPIDYANTKFLYEPDDV